MPEVHAILSASSTKRWRNCTPSARLEQNFPNESSVYAEEGTAAHALGVYKLRKYLHERVQRPTSEFDSEEMEGNTDIYAEFIINQIERIPGCWRMNNGVIVWRKRTPQPPSTRTHRHPPSSPRRC